MKTLVIIPALNEEKNVGKVVEECLKHTPGVLVVDDGSSDGTAKQAKSAGAVVLSNDINRGKGFCLRRGFDYAIEKDFHAVITLDADGQHDPEFIPDFIGKIEEGHDVVIGTRKKTHSAMPYHRRFSNFSLSLIFSLLSRQWIKDSQSGYRAFRVPVLKDLRLESDRFETESEILMKLGRKGIRFAETEIPVIYGEEKSHINVARDFFRFARVLKYRK